MAITSGLTIDPNVVMQGGPHETISLVAEGVISPGDGVKFGSTQEFAVICATDDVLCIGVADRNDLDANREGTNPMTDDYAADDQILVITKGLVRVIADTGGVVRGTVCAIGATVAGTFIDLAADSDVRLVKGRAMTTATATNAFLLNLGVL